MSQETNPQEISPKQPLGPNQQQWLAALRSGEYEQGRGQLETIGAPNTLCCLGVAARLFATEARVEEGKDIGYISLVIAGETVTRRYFAVAPLSVKEALGLHTKSGTSVVSSLPSLAQLNDGHPSPTIPPHTFAQIADIIEANPEAYFRYPK